MLVKTLIVFATKTHQPFTQDRAGAKPASKRKERCETYAPHNKMRNETIIKRKTTNEIRT